MGHSPSGAFMWKPLSNENCPSDVGASGASTAHFSQAVPELAAAGYEVTLVVADGLGNETRDG